tara:strand:+ start:477 stop:947 length:471 start_codon:yes stop_codon:yes gene_type:complete
LREKRERKDNESALDPKNGDSSRKMEEEINIASGSEVVVGQTSGEQAEDEKVGGKVVSEEKEKGKEKGKEIENDKAEESRILQEQEEEEEDDEVEDTQKKEKWDGKSPTSTVVAEKSTEKIEPVFKKVSGLCQNFLFFHLSFITIKYTGYKYSSFR